MLKRIAQVASLVGMASLAGCSNGPLNGQEGAACVRLAQCAPGLACVDGMCTTDLTALAEAGVVPVLDAGALMDVVLVDVATPDAVVPEDDAGN